MPKAPTNLREFEALLKVVEALRGPDGCPWDKEQTHLSLARFAIEEAHELAEAIESGEISAICEELGDVLLQVALNAEIARQEGKFDVSDVIQSINEKMIRRHPHVFANTKVESSAEVLKNWTEIKAKEKGTDATGFAVPVALPALLRAHKIGEKTKKVSFDWENATQCLDKVHEELAEFEAARSESKDRLEAELGDLLFSIAQLARHLDLDAEQALRKTNVGFERRFFRMQELVRSDGKDWSSLSAQDKETYWKRAKA